MLINFVLPGISKNKVIGGFRVHYEYANRLANLGHKVIVSHMFYAKKPYHLQKVRNLMDGDIRHLITWFEFSENVHVTTIFNNRFIKPCDVLVLTSWETAFVFGNRHDVAWVTAQIAYDYEFWTDANPQLKLQMKQAFAKPDVMISTSTAVGKMLAECGRRIDATINCGIRFEVFNLKNNIELRRNKIGILLRDDENKRVADAVKALAHIKLSRDVEVLAAGKWSKPLPDWITPVDTSTDTQLNEFYNSIGLFIFPSGSEGWGLPAMEALAGGVAVISSRNGGVEDFLKHEMNSLLYEPGNIAELISSIDRLLNNDDLRISLAKEGEKTARKYGWDDAVLQLEKLMIKSLNHAGT